MVTIQHCKTYETNSNGNNIGCNECNKTSSHSYVVVTKSGKPDKCERMHFCNYGNVDSPTDPKFDGVGLPPITEKCIEDSCHRDYRYNGADGKCIPIPGTAVAKAQSIMQQYIVTAEQQRQDIILWTSLFLVMLLIGFFIMKKMGVTSKKTGIFSWIGSDIKVNDLPVAGWVFIWTFVASVPIWWFGIDHCIQWGEDGRKILNYRSPDETEPEICNRMRMAGAPVPDSFFGNYKTIPNEACERPDGKCWNFHWRHFITFAISIIVCYTIFTALIVGAMPSGKFPDGIPLVLIISIITFSVETGWKRATWREKHNAVGEKETAKTKWKDRLTSDHQKPMVAQWQPMMLMGIMGFFIFGIFVFGGIGNKSLNDIDNEEKVMFGIIAVGWFFHWGYDLTQTYGIPFSDTLT
jgi:hypothetical protein